MRYIPGLRSYIRKEHKTDNYKRRYRYSFQNNNNRNNNNKLSRLLIISGIILIAVGVIEIFQNTIVYSPIKFFGTSKGGVSFVASTILLFIGIVTIVFERKHILGVILILLGIIIIVLSIFFSLKISLLPISLFKAILIFGFIFLGVALVAKGILKFIVK